MTEAKFVVATSFPPKGSPKGTKGDPIVYRLGDGNYVYVLKNQKPKRKGPENWALGNATELGGEIEIIDDTARSGTNQPLMIALGIAEEQINDLEDKVADLEEMIEEATSPKKGVTKKSSKKTTNGDVKAA